MSLLCLITFYNFRSKKVALRACTIKRLNETKANIPNDDVKQVLRGIKQVEEDATDV